jgi:hypothetical protein
MCQHLTHYNIQVLKDFITHYSVEELEHVPTCYSVSYTSIEKLNVQQLPHQAHCHVPFTTLIAAPAIDPSTTPDNAPDNNLNNIPTLGQAPLKKL